MKTPKNAKGSPDAKLHAMSAGSMKKSANASFKKKKLSLKDPQHAWDAVNDKGKFTPVLKNEKKSINGIGNTPKTDPKKKGKKSFQKGPSTPVIEQNITLNKSVNGSGGSGKKQKKQKKSLINDPNTVLNQSKSPVVENNKTPKGPKPKTPKIDQKKNVKNQPGTPAPQPKSTPEPSKKKRKSDEASPKQNKKLKKSPEVKLGLKIEKLLDKSPLSSKQTQKTKLNAESGSLAFLNKMTVTGAVKALLKHAETQVTKESNLFNTPQEFHILINFLKVPVAERGIIRVTLPHSRATETTSICLITADLSGAKKNNHEEAVQHYKDLLSANGVKGITEIIPFRQLKSEYTQIEQKRKLVNTHDIFLIESKLGHRMNCILKKSIMRRKVPAPVKLTAKNIANGIEVATRKVPLVLKQNGLTYTTTFGHSDMKLEHLIDNVMEVAKVLGSPLFKTGSKNLSSIFLKTGKGEGFPIFWSNASPNDVKDDFTSKPKSPKKMPVTDELSTFVNTNVTVHSDGRVTTKNIKKVNKKGKKVNKSLSDEDTDDESFDKSKYNLVLKGDFEDDDESDDLDSSIDDDDDDDTDEGVEIKVAFNGLKKSKNNLNETNEDETSSDEEEIEAAEQEFLKELREQQEKIQSGKKGGKPKKEVKGKPQNGKVPEPKVVKEAVSKKNAVVPKKGGVPPKKGAGPPKKGAAPPKKGPAPPKNAAMKVPVSPKKNDNKNKKPNMSPSPKGQQKPNINKAQKQKMNKNKRNSKN